MSIREFWIEWRAWGLRVATHNAVWTWIHRHDQHVRAWNDELL